MANSRVAVLCSIPEVRWKIGHLLASGGWQVHEYAALAEVDPAANWEAAVLECSLDPDQSSLDLAREIRLRNQSARIVVLARNGSEELAVEALRLGAAEYLKLPPSFPLDLERLACAVSESVAGAAIPRTVPAAATTAAIVGETSAIAGIKQFLPRIAASESNVLILGETGTGKEMIAEHIHRLGPRRCKPFVCVNCSAIPDSLIESELFGYEKGAFTGAASGRDGKLAQSHGGTLFFDEIGDMSPLAQAKILRAIESKEVCRLGGHRPTPLDLRLIAATNRDLESSIREGRFRTDLYFRLNVARIELPPLRARPSDIPLLTAYFVEHYNRVFGAAVERFEGEALQIMREYPWPGNVRELKNVVEIAFLHLSPGETVVRRLPEQVLSTWRKWSSTPADERGELVSVLQSTEWNISAAARKLEWSRMTMYRKLAKYHITPERGAPGLKKTATDGAG
jgi:DNA-binding NtrC family response regulator